MAKNQEHNRKEIVQRISRSIGTFIKHKTFSTWLEKIKLQENGLIILNNSFVFRGKVPTKKSNLYIALQVNEKKNPNTLPLVAMHNRINRDFVYLAPSSKKLPQMDQLNSALKTQVSQLGPLVFVLAGEVQDTITVEETLTNDIFKKVLLEPKLQKIAEIEEQCIKVRETRDEDAIWSEIEHSVKEKIGDEQIEEFKVELGKCLDSLQQKAYARLLLPSRRRLPKYTLLDTIIKALEGQKKEYQQSYNECRGKPEGRPYAYNNMLRIAYNFSSDATGFLDLLVSICDLKPVVLWMTIGSHYALSEAFKELPWTRSRNKASLDNYKRTIGDARNHVFHSLLPYGKRLNVEFGGTSLGTVTLELFKEYGNTKEKNQLNFRDRELVDALLEFTRATERVVNPDFWRKNIVVMNSTIDVLKDTNECLRTLASYSK